jgi:hypothetical protein
MEEAQKKENETYKKNVSCSSYCNTKKIKFHTLFKKKFKFLHTQLVFNLFRFVNNIKLEI